MEDKEPPRYYDWMLWMLRKESREQWYGRTKNRLIKHSQPDAHEILEERFSGDMEKSIRQNLPLYRSLSGRGLAEEIAATDPELVIDLGCGANPFKGIIPNLIGMDLVKFPTSDLVRPIQDAMTIFKPNIADWVLILGPWGPTDEETHRSIIAQGVHLLKPSGTIVAHGDITWTEERITRLGKEFSLETSIDGIGTTDMRKMTRKHYNIQRKALQYRAKVRGIHEEDNPQRVVWRWTYEF